MLYIYQMNGAAHGKGIYLSPLSSVSFGYTRGYYGKVKSDQQVSKRLTAINTYEHGWV